MRFEELGEHLSKPVGTSKRHSGHKAKIMALRHLIAATERRSVSKHIENAKRDHEARLPPWCTQIPNIDAALPTCGLNRYGLHEFSGTTHADTAAASGLLLALVKRLAEVSQPLSTAPILWCQSARMQNEFGPLYSAGLKAFGFDAERFLFARAHKTKDALWALEEGARSASLLAIIGEIDTASFTQTRRLQLASLAGATPVLLLRPHHDLAVSAAKTRWRISAEPGGADPFLSQVPGHPRWHLELIRCHGGRPGKWTVEWNNETYRFHLADKLSSGLPEVAGPPLFIPERRVASG